MSNKNRIKKKRGSLHAGDIKATKENGIIKFKLDPERDARIEREKQEDRDREENSKATLKIREWFMELKATDRTLGELMDRIEKLIEIIDTTISNPVIKAKIIKDTIYPGLARLHEANVLEKFTQLAIADCPECEWGGLTAFHRSVWDKKQAVMDCPNCKHQLLQRKGDMITEEEGRAMHKRLSEEP
jgi:hypothetical protein